MNKKEEEKIKNKKYISDRDEIIMESYKGMRTENKRMMFLLTKKPELDVIREYLIHLGLDNKHEYIKKIRTVQPFSILNDKQSRVTRDKARDPYKNYISKLKNRTPSKKYILEVIAKARQDGLLSKNYDSNTTNKSTKKKIDSTKIPLPLTYKELSEK